MTDRRSSTPFFILGEIVRNAEVSMKFRHLRNVCRKITIMACIAASGDKLPLCAVLKGTTQRCINNVLCNARSDVTSVQMYCSSKGWVNENIMLSFLRDVILPITNGRPFALILDGYAAHFTARVHAAAHKMHLYLIQVPRGCTVRFNGTFLSKRKQLWLTHKLEHPNDVDDIQSTIERAQRAYISVASSLVQVSFRF